MKTMLNKTATMLLLVATFALTACGTLNPLSHAQTAEQKAYALYGEFVVVEEQAVAVVHANEVGPGVILAIGKADAVAKPVADKLLDSAKVVRDARDALAAGTTTEEKVVIATANLQRWHDELAPLLADLVLALKGAK